jgi:phosphatidylethanolamine/phosphatidyl-N-methylethanolamine N-methyltransferase
MLQSISKKLSTKFNPEIRFFKGWMNGPKSVGTPFPTSRYTGQAMARVIRTDSGLPVLEVGPGTGVITAAILENGTRPDQLYAVEYSKHFVDGLRTDFPDAHILHGDAFALDSALGAQKDLLFDCVVSAIPLLNFPMPMRLAYVEDMLNRVPVGRPVVQVSYGPLSPVPAGLGSFRVCHHEFILRNIPPAQLWTYSRDGKT